MTILIVDDEKISRDSLEWMISREWPEGINIHSARSGLEGIDMASELRPDIVLMDIRMPGISGLDAAREILGMLPETVILFISAHEEFQYARKALQLGAADYINKPVERKEFITVLRKTMEKAERDKEERKKTLRQRNDYFLTRPILEQNLIYNILLTNSLPGPELMELGEMREILKSGGRVLTVQSVSSYTGGDNSDPVLEDLKLQLRQEFDCLLGPVILSSLTVLITDGRFIPDKDLEFRRALTSFWNALAEDTRSSLRIGAGSFSERDNFPVSYNQSLQALSRADKGEMQFYCDLSNQDGPAEAALPVVLNTAGNPPDFLVDTLQKRGVPLEKIRIHLAEEAVQTVLRLKNLDVLKDEWFLSGQYLKDLFTSESRKDILEWIRSFITFRDKENHSRRDALPFLDKAKELLDKSFADHSLSLEYVAGECDVNPAYLSLRFRERFGINFMQYLTDLRLNQACAYLKEKSMSVKEISFKVGYRDPNYFSRLFRNRYGLPPSDFRRKSGL